MLDVALTASRLVVKWLIGKARSCSWHSLSVPRAPPSLFPRSEFLIAAPNHPVKVDIFLKCREKVNASSTVVNERTATLLDLFVSHGNLTDTERRRV